VPTELQLLTEINNFAQSTPWLHLPMLLLSTYATAVYVVLWVAAFWSRAGGPARARWPR